MWTLVAVGVGTSGCATIGTFQTADTLGKGDWQVGVEPSAWGAIGDGATAVPHVGVSARLGVSDRTDLGMRIGSTGIELLTKFALEQGDEAEPDETTISLAPSLGGFVIGGTGGAVGSLGLQVPVLIGVPFGRNQLVLGPKVHVLQVFASADGSAAAATLISTGTSVGFSARVSDAIRILPELTAVYPFAAVGAASGEGSAAAVGAGGGVLFQAGVGILIGDK